MTRLGALAIATGLLVLGAACGDEEGDVEPSTTTVVTGDTSTTATTAAGGGTTTTEASTTTSAAAAGEADYCRFDGQTFDTPEAAADGWMSSYLSGFLYELEPFQQGDTTSGEIPVLSGGDEGSGRLRSTLVLRNEGEGWCVTAAVSEFVSFTSHEAGDTVGPGVFLVQGEGRGFEGSIAVSVRRPNTNLAEVPGQGGSSETPEPYEVQIDLGGASTGPAALLAQGGTGLDGDPGEFAAIPIVIE